MSATGVLCAVLLWMLAASALTGYEINVRVLRPWQRQAYGVAAFAAGIALALLVARGGAR